MKGPTSDDRMERMTHASGRHEATGQPEHVRDFVERGLTPSYVAHVIRDELGAAKDALRSVVAPFATLLLLRWLEHFDAERKPATLSRSARQGPLLTPDRHWTAWCHLEGEDLCRFFRRQLVPALESAPNVGWSRALRPLTNVLTSCRSIPPAHLSRLISLVESFDLSGSRGRADAGQALQFLIEDTRDAIQFATTWVLADLMVALLDPKPGARIYDPCFGVGGLLARAGPAPLSRTGSCWG